MTAIGPAVLALDDLLTDPEAARMLDELRHLVPTGLLDQADAAAAHLHRGTAAAAAAGAFESFGGIAMEEVPGWVRLGLLDTLLRWTTGEAETCLHAPVATRPQPVFAAAWKPGRVVCARCGHLLKLPARSPEERRCDGCGCIVAGDEHGDPIWPISVQCGGINYAHGCCRDCRYWAR